MFNKKKIKLGVNIDHVATLRQVRGATTDYPDLLEITKLVKKAGADQITIHLREDRRHIQDVDLILLSKKCPLPLNLEMAATNEMVQLACRYKPNWCCLVPESRKELTTEGGLDVFRSKKKFKTVTTELKNSGIMVSHFIDSDLDQVKASYWSGADAVEFHTGRWVLSKGAAKVKEWTRLKKASQLAHQLGLRVHAGHGLDFESAKKVKKLPYLIEVNIGHSLVCYAIEMGIVKVVREMIKCL